MNLVITNPDELSVLIEEAMRKAIDSDVIQTLIERAVENAMKGTQENVVDHVLPIRQAADYLRISDRTLRRMIHEDAIPHFRNRNRIFLQQAELDAWIRRRTTHDQADQRG